MSQLPGPSAPGLFSFPGSQLARTNFGLRDAYVSVSLCVGLGASALLGGCSSDSSTDAQAPMAGIAAGEDIDALPAESIYLEAIATAGLTVAWSQVSGPPVELDSQGGAVVPFLTPTLPGEVVLRATATGSGGQVVATDDVSVAVRTVRVPESFQVLVRHSLPDTLSSDSAAPTAVAYADKSERAFVLDAAGHRVLVVGLEDPSNPVDLGVLPDPATQGSFTAGDPRAVAAKGNLIHAGDDLLAVVYDGTPASAPGRLVFFDSMTLTEISSYEVGSRPSALKWAQLVDQVVVACAGDPLAPATGTGPPIDGTGCAMLFRIPASGPANLNEIVDISRVDFSAFNSQRAALLADGVRLPRPEVPVSRDLEPRSVALDPNGERAWLGLPANGAVAVLNFSTGSVESIRGLQPADWRAGSLPMAAEVTARVTWDEGRPSSPVSFPQGIFDVPELDVSAIEVVGVTGNTYEFDFVMGRGPARAVLSATEGYHHVLARPDFEHRVVRATVNLDDGSWTLSQEIPLRTGDSLPISARAGLQATSTGLAFYDEGVKGPDLSDLPLDLNGAILTGIARVNGEIWCSDSRRPSLLRFDASGLLLERYVPEGSNGFGALLGAESLPARYAQAPEPSRLGLFRGGFQGLAVLPTGQIATILHASLDNPDTATNEVSIGSRIVRLLVLDPSTGTPTQEYAVVMDDAGSGVADLLVIDGELHLVEESSCSGSRRLMRLALGSATNLLELGANGPQIQSELEATDPADLATAFPVPVLPAGKLFISDLTAAGLVDGVDFSLAQFDGELLFATSDGFGYQGVTTPDALLFPCAGGLQEIGEPSFGKLVLHSRGIDPSDQDAGQGPRDFPVQGLRQIVDLVVAPGLIGGRPVVRCMDGQVVRDLGGGVFEESAHVRDLILDAQAFPNAASLQSDSELGSLVVSKLDGDADEDGLYESLLAFGGRSILTLDEHMNQVHDSGDTIDRQQRKYSPEVAQRLEASASSRGAGLAAAVLLPPRLDLGVVLEDAGVVALFETPGAGGLLWTGNLPLAPGASPTALLGYTRLDTVGNGRLLLVTDRAHGTLDVIQSGP